MATRSLTPEQEQVVHHPLGQHARVLAVAGSGKSTTMAHRIQYLVTNHQVRPSSVLVLMFNALARKQFNAHLDKVGLPANLQPTVHTFHSFSFQLINQMVKTGMLPASTQYWLADKTELIWLTVKRAITALEKAKRVPPETIDPEEALNAIGLWKGSLIPPERAGSYTSPYLPLVYAEFETLRQAESALTFDDFIPMAVSILSNNPTIQQQYRRELRHLIIDEYQDINYGQQSLIELLAGEQADVMVVGDDDQTIYEWRGARPNYILRDLAENFHGKPVLDYRLSRSFRFGPLIAQCAANVIATNTTRVEKPLIAFQSGKSGFIQLYNGGFDASKQLADQVVALTQVDKVPTLEIIVLARLYAQLDNLEAEFLTRKIPYRIDGQEPFFKRQEINTLLDYLRLAQNYRKPITDVSAGWLLNIANKPSRMLSRSVLGKFISNARYQRLTIQDALASVSRERIFAPFQTEKLNELHYFLNDLAGKLSQNAMLAGDLLDWVVEMLDYLAYFQDYYGKGEHADEKKYAVQNFIRFVKQLRLPPAALLDHLKSLDTTQGKPEEEQIIFTTIFRTKGLEYDYVIIPQCDENLLPYLKGDRTDIYDMAGIVQESQMSSALESERRLFYVALTRARKGVFIGASARPSRFLDELLLKETERVMGALVYMQQGDERAKSSLLSVLQNGAAYPHLLQNIVNGYLPDMGQTELASRIQREWTLPVQQPVEAVL